MTVIQTNVQALMAHQALRIQQRNLSTASAQLATGQRILHASDDAAGAAMGSRLTTQIRGLDTAVRNANDGISLAQTADAGLAAVTGLLQRMRELAVQASTEALDSTQRGYLDEAFTALQAQASATLSTTTWKGHALLSATSAQVYAIRVGGSADTEITITAQAVGVGSGQGIATLGAAAAALGALDTHLQGIAQARAHLGASVHRLTHAADQMTTIQQNLQASRSRIVDTDYAQATTELARALILEQAGSAILAQANQQPAMVLALLR